MPQIGVASDFGCSVAGRFLFRSFPRRMMDSNKSNLCVNLSVSVSLQWPRISGRSNDWFKGDDVLDEGDARSRFGRSLSLPGASPYLRREPSPANRKSVSFGKPICLSNLQPRDFPTFSVAYSLSLRFLSFDSLKAKGDLDLRRAIERGKQE
jgi:hypothetical protein